MEAGNMATVPKDGKWKTRGAMAALIAVITDTSRETMINPTLETKAHKAGKIAAINHNNGVMTIGIEKMRVMGMDNKTGKKETSIMAVSTEGEIQEAIMIRVGTAVTATAMVTLIAMITGSEIPTLVKDLV